MGEFVVLRYNSQGWVLYRTDVQKVTSYGEDFRKAYRLARICAQKTKMILVIHFKESGPEPYKKVPMKRRPRKVDYRHNLRGPKGHFIPNPDKVASQ